MWLNSQDFLLRTQNEALRGHSITTWTKWGGRGHKMSVFVHANGIKTVHARGGGQKMAKFCCWMTPFQRWHFFYLGVETVNRYLVSSVIKIYIWNFQARKRRRLMKIQMVLWALKRWIGCWMKPAIRQRKYIDGKKNYKTIVFCFENCLNVNFLHLPV